MTQKEIDKFLADTKVYVNGKSEEIQEKLFSLGYKWSNGKVEVDYIESPFLFVCREKCFYRRNSMEDFINNDKREITADEILSLKLDKPEYRPFKDRDECWNEMLKHQPFGWVKGIGSTCYNIASIDTTSVYFSNSTQCFYQYSLKNHFFMDGTPFGVKEE